MYEYDNAGNITAKKKYAFTTGTLGTVQTTYTYSYNDSSWGDLLTSYDSTTIVYDEIGNPVRIGNYNAANDAWWDGYDLTWVGRQLMSYTAFYRYEADEELSYRTPVTFTYNADGIRTGKTTYGYEHKYYLDGTQITAEMWTQNNVEYLLYYLYDENGAPIGMQYRTSNYASGVFDFFFFDKNLQGDVIGIYNADGEKICTYTYDAWGICNIALTSGTSSLERSIAVTYNPFRYRGYYYDTETGLYYLQSRYYNPEWGRFINADEIAYLGLNDQLKGYNLYSYCANNPISYFDTTGNFLGTLIGAVVGGAFGAITAAISGKSGDEIWASTVNGMIAGAASGLAADVIALTGGSAAVVVGAYAAAGAAGSFIGTLAENSINGEDITSTEVLVEAGVDALWGGTFGALGGLMTGPVTSLMDDAVQHAGKRLLARGGVTVGYAVKKALKKELKNVGPVCVEEFLSNFNSWYFRENFENQFG